MSKAQLVITAVVLEGRSKSDVARDYDVYRRWVQQLCRAEIWLTVEWDDGFICIGDSGIGEPDDVIGGSET